jgi:hypothetical protein
MGGRPTTRRAGPAEAFPAAACPSRLGRRRQRRREGEPGRQETPRRGARRRVAAPPQPCAGRTVRGKQNAAPPAPTGLQSRTGQPAAPPVTGTGGCRLRRFGGWPPALRRPLLQHTNRVAVPIRQRPERRLDRQRLEQRAPCFLGGAGGFAQRERDDLFLRRVVRHDSPPRRVALERRPRCGLTGRVPLHRHAENREQLRARVTLRVQRRRLRTDLRERQLRTDLYGTFRIPGTGPALHRPPENSVLPVSCWMNACANGFSSAAERRRREPGSPTASWRAAVPSCTTVWNGFRPVVDSTVRAGVRRLAEQRRADAADRDRTLQIRRDVTGLQLGTDLADRVSSSARPDGRAAAAR